MGAAENLSAAAMGGDDGGAIVRRADVCARARARYESVASFDARTSVRDAWTRARACGARSPDGGLMRHPNTEKCTFIQF